MLCIGYRSSSVSVGLSDDLLSIGLSFLNNLGLDEIRLSDDFVVFDVCFSIDLVNEGVSFSSPLALDSLGLGFDSLDFLGLLHLLELCLLILVLSLLFLDLLHLRLLLLIVFNSLLEGKSFPFEGVSELEDGLLLHGVGHLLVQNHIGDDASLDHDALVVEVGVQVLKHALGVLLSSQGVSFSSLDSSSHGSYSLHNVGVDGLVNLGDIGNQLLHVFVLGHDLQQN